MTTANRSKTRFDENWKFTLEESPFQNGDPGFSGARNATGYAAASYDDRCWREVTLPHDWAVELPFDLHACALHGHKPVPVLASGVDVRQQGIAVFPVGWYRKTFEVPEAAQGRRTWLVFDGIFRDATVWINSHFIERHLSGYLPLRLDISDMLDYGGRNVVAVRVDASQREGWWYEGAGIYRHVWLEEAGPVHIAPDTLFADAVPQGSGARLDLSAEIMNARAEAAAVQARARVLDIDGAVVAAAEVPVTLHGWETEPLALTLAWDQAVRWSLDDPYRYQVELQLLIDRQMVDVVTTHFGVRDIRFDPQAGFFLNGQPVRLKGTCNHQDFAGVGVALPDRLHEYKIQRLKEIGCNAYRCAHHAHAPEILEACDRLGMLVMDEARTLGSGPEQMRQLEALIRRDRNHPSVILWSLGNEENGVQNLPVGRRMAQTMIRSIRALDPTRLITYAGNNGEGWDGVNEVVDVRGWNYFTHFWESSMDRYHADHPDQPVIGSEEVSAFNTRDSSVTDRERQIIRDVDESASSWGSTAEGWWRYVMARPWMAGGFAWTGFDYRGEPGPFMRGNISNFGLLDLCGFIKSGGRYLQSWWSDQPVLHLVPHWTHPGQEGQAIEVVVYSSCETVELFLNGQSLGRQEMVQFSHLRWQVTYAPGKLEAVGYRNGQACARAARETAGEPAGIRLTADRPLLRADGQDVALVQVELVDRQGRPVPENDREITLHLDGAGKILGVGNGDPNSSEPEQYHTTWEKRAIGGWASAVAHRADAGPDEQLYQPYNIDNPLPAVWAGEQNAWRPAWDERTPAKIPGPRELVWWIEPGQASEMQVFTHTRIHLFSEDISAGWTWLAFGRVFSYSEVYINGRLAGELPAQPGIQYLNAAPFLSAGTNFLEVHSPVSRGAGGIAGGAWLCRQNQPVWRRRTFHGLALVLVQAGKEPSQAILCAEGAGLEPAQVTLHWEAQPSPAATPPELEVEKDE